jgi:hypothetical protein
MNRVNNRLIDLRQRSRRPTTTNLILTGVNLFFACLTIGMTIMSAYFNFFRVSDQLHARLTWSNHFENIAEDSLGLNIAVFNLGNRPALVSEFKVVQVTLKNGTPSSWSYAAMPNLNPGLPILIEPGQISLVALKVKYPTQDWFNNAVEADSTEPNLRGSHRVNVGLMWTAIDSRGRSFNNLSVVAHLYLTKKAVAGFGAFADELDLYTNL